MEQPLCGGGLFDFDTTRPPEQNFRPKPFPKTLDMNSVLARFNAGGRVIIDTNYSGEARLIEQDVWRSPLDVLPLDQLPCEAFAVYLSQQVFSKLLECPLA